MKSGGHAVSMRSRRQIPRIRVAAYGMNSFLENGPGKAVFEGR
jgi:hypothetical protein